MRECLCLCVCVHVGGWTLLVRIKLAKADETIDSCCSAEVHQSIMFENNFTKFCSNLNSTLAFHFKFMF